MLAKSPADRFPTPQDTAAALTLFCHGADLAALLAEAQTRTEQPPEPEVNEYGDTLVTADPPGSDTPTAGTRTAEPIDGDGMPPEPRSPRGQGGRTIALSVLAGIMAIVAGVILIIRDRDGKVKQQIVVGPDEKIEIVESTPAGRPAMPQLPKGVPGGVNTAWINRTAELHAVEQAKAVAKELRRRNPDYRGYLDHDVEEAKVTDWTITGGTLGDLSPLLALTELKRLNYAALDPGRDAPVLREMTSLETINDRSAATFRLAFPASKPQGGVEAAWVEAVRRAPPEIQLKAVTQKLRDLNPNFDGAYHLYRMDEDGAMHLGFSSDAVTDLSPLKALPRLQTLWCRASGVNRSWLSDLAPLKGLPLTELDCHWTRVADLTPLGGMPLAKLHCDFTLVADLSPLRGMPLTKLACGGTRVSDLSPLKGMPLTELYCGSTPVADPSPLEGMPLKALACDNTPVADLAPLKGLPLTALHCPYTRVSDLSPLAGLPLKEIGFTAYLPANIAVVRGIETLTTINGQPAAEFWKEFDGKATDPSDESSKDRL
jgi:hypothetical protein